MKFGTERFVRNVLPDLRDNLSSEKPPLLVNESLTNPIEAEKLVERLISPDVQKEFLDSFNTFESGEYRARVAVGKVEEGTRHPHDYIVTKDPNGLELYFVDPEHQMGKSKNRSAIPLLRKGDLRPKISTLIGMRMSENEIPNISILRYRAAAISDPRLLKMDAQYEIAKEILANSNIPEILKGKESEITFRMNIQKDHMLVQSRYANEGDLKRFLKGDPTASALEGKIQSFGLIMRQFLKHLNEGRFESLASSSLKKAA